MRLEIDGRDLLAAGIPEGPEIGARLQRTLDRKLDGEIDAFVADRLLDMGFHFAFDRRFRPVRRAGGGSVPAVVLG